MVDLRGRAVLVTGGAWGVGAVTCRMLARAGADVAVHYASGRTEAQRVAADVDRLQRRAVLLQADLRDLDRVDELPRRAHEALARLDVLVNAGIWRHARLESVTPELRPGTMRVDLDAIDRLTRSAVPFLRQSDDGSIVNVTATAARPGEPARALDATSTGALIRWTKSLAVEFGPDVRVNAVAPGRVEAEVVVEELREPGSRGGIVRDMPRGRIAAPEDVAGAILFLVSDLADHITGEVLNVNGGSILCG